MSERDESSSFTGRLARNARTATAIGGLAARLAGERYLGLSIDREAHARTLREALGGLKGPLMKVAQLLATIPEALPQEYAGELAQLQSDAPPMGWAFVRRRMAAELGPDWERRFQSFSREALAAASLGQVHKGVLPDGRMVAAKLQYPDMASAVEADLGQLKRIFALFERFDKAVRTEDIHAEVAERLREELDYTREAQNLRLYAHILRDEADVHVPDIVPELCTRRLLTMEWVDGVKVDRMLDRPLEERNEIARRIFRAWYVPFYRYGVIHGDPHLGNYSVRPDLHVNLLDFGAVRVFQPKFVKGVIDLWHALKTNDRERELEAFRIWGFDDLKPEIIEAMDLWARFLYEPLLDDRVRIVGHDEGAVYGREKATQVHKVLRDSGGVHVPRPFVFIDRAAIGLGSVFIRMKAELNWSELFQELIADFTEEGLAQRQHEALAAAGLEHLAAAA